MNGLIRSELIVKPLIVGLVATENIALESCSCPSRSRSFVGLPQTADRALEDVDKKGLITFARSMDVAVLAIPIGCFPTHRPQKAKRVACQ